MLPACARVYYTFDLVELSGNFWVSKILFLVFFLLLLPSYFFLRKRRQPVPLMTIKAVIDFFTVHYKNLRKQILLTEITIYGSILPPG